MFILQQPAVKVIACGSSMFAGSVASMNWENNVWSQTGYVIAAEVFSEVNIAQSPYAQKISLNGDAIQAVSFTADANVAGGNLIGELRESLNSKAIASGEIAIEKAGVQNYQIDFGKKLKSLPIKIIILFYGLKIMIMYNGIITLLLKQVPIV